LGEVRGIKNVSSILSKKLKGTCSVVVVIVVLLACKPHDYIDLKLVGKVIMGQEPWSCGLAAISKWLFGA